jgi:hypothetical protein
MIRKIEEQPKNEKTKSSKDRNIEILKIHLYYSQS